jgi:hypothetical protein
MASRSDTPGLIAIKRKNGFALYWSARSLARDVEGFPDRLVRIPATLTPAEVVTLCALLTAKFEAWQLGDRATSDFHITTVASLCDAFERHPHSPLQDVKANTAGSYLDSTKIIRREVGGHLVKNVTPITVKGWFADWSAPAKPDGPPRLKRAHDAVSILRAMLGVGYVLGYNECGELREKLAMVRFKKSGRREGAMTYAHAVVFIAKAREVGKVSMALGVAAQFETLLRQKDIIGEYGADDAWTGHFTWENCPGWSLKIKTSKNKAPITFDLTNMELLWPLLQAVPQSERVGAIIKGPTGAPMRERTYRKWFRQIATQAGIPVTVWNMDSRAGGVTEALEGGADIEDVARAATHSKTVMTERYDRGVAQSVVEIAEVRQAKRRGTGTA